MHDALEFPGGVPEFLHGAAGADLFAEQVGVRAAPDEGVVGLRFEIALFVEGVGGMEELVEIRHRRRDQPTAERHLVLFLHFLFVGDGGFQPVEAEFEAAGFRFLAQDGEHPVDRSACPDR